jgi:murein DD-endopeptidase MepM/ murein hydrolase activator NlpD
VSEEVASESQSDRAEGGRADIVIYVVQEGDTLIGIANEFGISVETITSANDITARTTLRPGDELTVLPIDGVQHTIIRGETLSHISQEYDADIDEIIVYNNIEDESRIQPGEKLIIPGGESEKPQTPTLAIQKTPAAPAPTTVPAGTITTPEPPAPPAKVDVAGYFIFPTSGKITQGLHFYNAVDIGGSAYCGSPVKASASGTILTAVTGGWNGGYGNYVKIQHPNGTETIYAHNAQNLVVVGQKVEQGQTIGLMGSTGNSTGCHVHFAVRGAANPFAY